MSTNLQHIFVPLNLTNETSQTLKLQFSYIIEQFINNQYVTASQIEPLRDMLSNIVSNHPKLLDLFKNKLKTGCFFALHIQHYDPEILNLPWCIAKDSFSGKSIEDIDQIFLINNLT